MVTEGSEFQSDKDVGGESGAGDSVRGVYDSQSVELADTTVNLPVTDNPQTTDISAGGWGQYGGVWVCGHVVRTWGVGVYVKLCGTCY